MKCKSCNCSVSYSDKFCRNCGAKCSSQALEKLLAQRAKLDAEITAQQEIEEQCENRVAGQQGEWQCIYKRGHSGSCNAGC